MKLSAHIPWEGDAIDYTTVRGVTMRLPSLRPAPGVFVTGTDTDVGKTWVAAGLTWALRRRGINAVYFKPVQSGCPEQDGRLVPTDAAFVRDLAGLDEPLDLLTPVALRLPLAPGIAARQEGVAIDLGRVAQAYATLVRKYNYLVVEGAGGLYVPLVETEFLVLDMIRWLKLPLVVVARAGLGTINHTVLTVTAARQAGVSVAGVIINQYPEKPSLAVQTNPEVIEELAATPILGRAPRVEAIENPECRRTFLAAMEEIVDSMAPLTDGMG